MKERLATIVLGERTFHLHAPIYEGAFSCGVGFETHPSQHIHYDEAAGGKEDFLHFLQYADEIPLTYKDTFYFVFPNYRYEYHVDTVWIILCFQGRWQKEKSLINLGLVGIGRALIVYPA